MKLELQGIKKSFDGTEILHGINFSVEGGSALGLLGRNGAGKTTTIRIIMDVFHADEGQVLLDGAPFVYQPGQVGYLPEERGLYPKRLISEQLVYLAKLRGMNKKQAEENMRKWLTRLDVIQYENRKLDTLSKGNQQKVQLAATLVADPDIVILDERESHFRAFPPISILGEERPQNERVRPNTFRDWPPCPPIQRGGGERSRPGVSPFISALTVSCRPATFPGVWPHIWSRCPELWDFLSHRPGAEDEGRGLS